jgi:hypothetical protein
MARTGLISASHPEEFLRKKENLRMRIFEVKTERPHLGCENYASYKVAANTAMEAIQKAKKEFFADERVIEIELLASASL